MMYSPKAAIIQCEIIMAQFQLARPLFVVTIDLCEKDGLQRPCTFRKAMRGVPTVGHWGEGYRNFLRFCCKDLHPMVLRY